MMPELKASKFEKEEIYSIFLLMTQCKIQKVANK